MLIIFAVPAVGKMWAGMEVRMEEKEKNKTDDEMLDMDYLFNAASCNDCTGLIPAGNVEADELGTYKELYDFGVPEINGRKKSNVNE